MASFATSSGKCWIDYSIRDGSVKRFVYKGRVLYDAFEGVERSHWKQLLASYAKRLGLHRPDGGMYPAWIMWLADAGLLELK